MLSFSLEDREVASMCGGLDGGRNENLHTHPRPTGSRTIPGIKDIKATVLEVCNIARRELGPSHLGNGCDLRIGVADRPAERTTVSGNRRKNSRCVTLEPEDAPATGSRDR